jgi:hypothetical protein
VGPNSPLHFYLVVEEVGKEVGFFFLLLGAFNNLNSSYRAKAIWLGDGRTHTPKYRQSHGLCDNIYELAQCVYTGVSTSRLGYSRQTITESG